MVHMTGSEKNIGSGEQFHYYFDSVSREEKDALGADSHGYEIKIGDVLVLVWPPLEPRSRPFWTGIKIFFLATAPPGS